MTDSTLSCALRTEQGTLQDLSPCAGRLSACKGMRGLKPHQSPLMGVSAPEHAPYVTLRRECFKESA
ncbi:MAG TPA: hypothetical protein IAB18_08315 [Candidatus Avisuccinivibrio pullicola]|nr:hypothetical protein [Candidatus Avisuccinivibrio pullicola]